MKILKEGYFLILAAAVSSIVFFLFAGRHWVFCALGWVMLVKAIFFAFFFRDPEREIKDSHDVVLSPADGKVLEVIENDSEKIIRIFLSVFNVHIQRSPVEGIVSKLENKKGKFYAANNPKAHKLNEQNIITIKNGKGETFKVHQIVGVIARRLILWINENQSLKQGEKLGMIKFGSQVDISLPVAYSVKVKATETVKAGISVLAYSLQNKP